MKVLSENFLQFQNKYKISKYFIAYSGGMDSHVLLHAMRQLVSTQIELLAVHIHHGLSNNADAWQQHCEKVCADLGVQLETLHIDIKTNKGESLEACARELRYKVFKQLMDESSCLVTAHHQDDQAETLLLNCLRGSGVRGLAAMPTIKSFAQGIHWRPLLNISRKELSEYARQHDLQWIDDESNFDTDFDRNYLRHQVFPKINQRWPNYQKIFARVTDIQAETQHLLGELAEADLQPVILATNILCVSKLKKLSIARQANLIRYWVTVNDFPLPNREKLQQILFNVLNAKIDATPLVEWQATQVRRYRDGLYIMSPLSIMPDKWSTQFLWQGEHIISLPAGLGDVHLGDKQFKLPQSVSITIKFRENGETIKLSQQQGTKVLKKLFQQWGVPPWQRDRLPLLYVDGILVAVIGYVIADEYKNNAADF